MPERSSNCNITRQCNLPLPIFRPNCGKYLQMILKAVSIVICLMFNTSYYCNVFVPYELFNAQNLSFTTNWCARIFWQCKGRKKNWYNPHYAEREMTIQRRNRNVLLFYTIKRGNVTYRSKLPSIWLHFVKLCKIEYRLYRYKQIDCIIHVCFRKFTG